MGRRWEELGGVGRNHNQDILCKKRTYFQEKEKGKKVEKKRNARPYPPQIANTSFIHPLNVSGVPPTCPVPCSMLKMLQW